MAHSRMTIGTVLTAVFAMSCGVEPEYGVVTGRADSTNRNCFHGPPPEGTPEMILGCRIDGAMIEARTFRMNYGIQGGQHIDVSSQYYLDGGDWLDIDLSVHRRDTGGLVGGVVNRRKSCSGEWLDVPVVTVMIDHKTDYGPSIITVDTVVSNSNGEELRRIAADYEIEILPPKSLCFAGLCLEGELGAEDVTGPCETPTK